MVTNYIQELLATNNRVIIPNYGAFLVRATSKGKDSNKLEEKLNDVYFSPFLKFNDELLERFIIKKEGITKDQAAGKIRNFIEEVKIKLNNDSVFDINNFGQFTMDKQGKVVFTPVSKELEVKEPKEEKAEETMKKEPKKPTSKTVKEPAKKATVKTKTTKATEKILVVDTKPDLEPIKPEIKVEEKPIIKPEQKTPITITKPEIKHTQPKKETTVNKGLVWSIAIGLPLAAIFIWALLNFDTINKIIKKEKKQETKIEKVVTTKPVEESTENIEKEAPPAENIEQASTKTNAQVFNNPSDSQKKYYIVAGSFKNATYADTYLKSLQEKGFPAERLAERNGMYAVSYNSFTDKTQALAEYRVITREKGLTAWILYY